MKILQLVNSLSIFGFGICAALAAYKSFVIKHYLSENSAILSDANIAAFHACLSVWGSLAVCALIAAVLAVINLRSNIATYKIKE